MLVMIIDEDPTTARALELVLLWKGHKAFVSEDAEDGISIAKTGFNLDLIVLDMSLRSMRGAEALRTLRRDKVKTPILALCEALDPERLCEAFDLGADAVVQRPYDSDVLLSQALAVVRRSAGHSRSVVAAGGLEIDLSFRRVTYLGTPVPLTDKETGVLEMLALRKDRLVTKEMLLQHLYSGRDEPELKIIDVFICKIRKKLMAATGFNFIETVWGRGYQLRDPDLCPPVPNPYEHPVGTTRDVLERDRAAAEKEWAGS